MTDPIIPVDQEHRLRIAESLDENLFVEAGAGTGKTTSLVARIVSLITSGRATIDGIAAITFTEAAASELQERVRTVLEEKSEAGGLDSSSKELCFAALQSMDRANIQTLHSFAGSLLRERPLEAGLPPNFETADAIKAEIDFDEWWERWLDEIVDSPEVAPDLLIALSLGLRVGNLREVAESFHENYDLLNSDFPHEVNPEFNAVTTLIGARDEIRSLLPLAIHGLDDPLAEFADRITTLAERLLSTGTSPIDALATLSRWGRLNTNQGRQSDWEISPKTGVNGCKALKDLLKGLDDLKNEELETVRRSILTRLLSHVRKFVLEYAEDRRRSGSAEFHDLLIWARNLLRNDSESRAHFQRKFTHILVDEFQDTDPIQAEIAFFLAESVPADGQLSTITDWTQLELEQGKLFVVGDPKQSIYRFRRADIGSLAQVRDLIKADNVPLVQNFRSQEPIIDWVNSIFTSWMGDGSEPELQADYTALAHSWTPPDCDPPLGVHLIGGEMVGSAGMVREVEAGELARLINSIVSGTWQVRDEQSEGFRPANYADICILLPTRTILSALEHAFDESGVPYRVESQSLVLGTQDVRDLINCLRAIDAPSDQVALVAALRSSAFACSDVELLAFVESGGKLNYLDPGESNGPVREAMDILCGFHRGRVWERLDDIIEGLIRAQRMVEGSFGRARPRERWRRLRFMVEQARTFMGVGGSSLRDFVDWIERQAKEGARMVEVPVPETDEDSIRIMTVHASKGLEFPITILSGLASQRGNRSNTTHFNRVDGSVEVRVGSGNSGVFATAGYATARTSDQDADAAEDVRLMYVAATRARDHLVLSLFRSGSALGKRSRAAKINELCEENPDIWIEITEDDLVKVDVSTSQTGDSQYGLKTASDRQEWLERRAAVIQTASRPASIAATTLAHVEKEEADGGETTYRRGRGGTNLGRAVHSVLQSVDLESGEGTEEISRAQAAVEGMPQRWKEIADLARRAIDSEVVRRAVSSGRYYREVFVSAPVEGILVEGFIDLLFEEDDGLVIVDYKTDSLRNEEEIQKSMASYRLQGGAYALALQRSSGKSVKQAVFLFLQPEKEVAIEDLEGAIVDVGRMVVGSRS
jgi:ATP-dependent helicase/nuclease subunit A